MSTNSPVTRLTRLNNRLQELLSRPDPSIYHPEIAPLWNKMIETSGEILYGELPEVPISSKSLSEILKLFKLRLVEEEFDAYPLFQGLHEPYQAESKFAERVLQAYHLATNELSLCTQIDLVILLTLADNHDNYKKPETLGKSPLSTQDTQKGPSSLRFQRETHVSMPGKDRDRHGDSPVIWTGKTNYSIWYGSPQNAETNLVVVETERYSAYFAEPQLTGYMVLIYDARRKAGEPDASAYGIWTNGEDWKFFCIDHESRVSWFTLGWHVDKKKIVLLLDRILEKASHLATLSSTLTRKSTVSEATGIAFQDVGEMDISQDGDGKED